MSKKIKIACVGNMNNNMFAIMRFLRYRGYDAWLVVTNDFDHFAPMADTFETEYQEYVLNFDLIKTDILFTDRQKVNRFFSEFDFVIACGYSIAYLVYSKIYVDITIPYGSDLYDLPFYKPDETYTDYFKKQRKALAKYQRYGLENCKAVIFDYTNDAFEKIIQQFNFKGTRYKNTPPFIFTPEFNPGNIEKLRQKFHNKDQMEIICQKHDFVIFNQIRQSWKNPLDEWSYKGNERIFKAFSKFIKEQDTNACLIVFEYGTDVLESKQLVNSLGITESVYWFPVTHRCEILTMISYCDIGIGEVGDYSWFSYGAIFEFLCMKKPVIHNRKDEMYINIVDSLYPMYNASNEEEVFNALVKAHTNKAEALKISSEAHEWYVINAINKPLDVLTQAINSNKVFIRNLKKYSNSVSLYLSRVMFFLSLKLNIK